MPITFLSYLAFLTAFHKIIEADSSFFLERLALWPLKKKRGRPMLQFSSMSTRSGTLQTPQEFGMTH